MHKMAPASGWNVDSVVEHIMIHYRWIFVIFLLPVSLLFDTWLYARNWIVFKLNSAPGKHSCKVKEVQRQVEQWQAEGGKVKMCTSRPGWQMMSFRSPIYKKTYFKVKVNLVDIVHIDAEKRTVLVEPLVNMGQLSATLHQLGWTIPVLPEMDDLTVGGLVMGTGVETSSHKFGLFQHICESFELVLADGQVVKCSKDEDPDLFYAVPWSYGTLGLLTAVELKIVPALRFVKVEYEPAYTLDKVTDVFTRETLRESGNEFVEALMFSENEGVIMTANMVSCAEPGKLNEIGRWYKPWFFEHVRTFLKKGKSVEYIPLRDYYHRHSKSIFWEIQDIVPFGNQLWFRYLLGWLMPPKVSLLKLTTTPSVKKLYENHHIIQDMLVPLPKFKEAIQLFEKEVKVYPIWVCPFVLPRRPGMLRTTEDNAMYVDVGTYGVPKEESFEPAKTIRRIEAFVTSVNGFQMLYADTFMTKEEFRTMFDHTLYDKVRSRLGCENAFPEVYDKVCRSARH